MLEKDRHMKNWITLLGLSGLLFLTGSCLKDGCEDVVCLNNGACLEGTCFCPLGYFGEFCGEFRYPTKLELLSVAVTAVPNEKPGGGPYDLLDEPDLVIQVIKDGQVLAESEVFENTILVDEKTLILDPPLELDLDGTYVFEAADYDEGGILEKIPTAAVFSPRLYFDNFGMFFQVVFIPENPTVPTAGVKIELAYTF